MYFPHEPVIVFHDRAYPLSVLMWHEVVNDQVEDRKIVITYCPLCNAALVFSRELDWQGKHLVLDFGTSGMLRKSDLVMWDRQTESWWQQIEGKALVGSLAGATLEMLPSQVLSYAAFRSAYPYGKVLSTQTGWNRDYGTNPYAGYDDTANHQPRLFEDAVDPRLPAMERVIALEFNNKHKAYPWSVLQEKGIIQDTFENHPVVIFYQLGTVSVLDRSEIHTSRDIGTATVFNPVVDGNPLQFTRSALGIFDQQTHSQWDITGKCISGALRGKQLSPWFYTTHFAFAYLAFFPDAIIYKP